MRREGTGPLRVVIAGGGVAALEGALALRELAGDMVAVTMLAPEREFVYRPMRVEEPFAGPLAQRWELRRLADAAGAQLRPVALAWIDQAARIAHTTGGDRFPYDALLLAPGARRHERFRHVTTLDDARLEEQLHGLVQDVEAGYVHSLAFLVPSRLPWPLPVYELALMTAQRAQEMNVELHVTIVTPERGPLEVFGPEATRLVARRLKAFAVEIHCETRCEVIAPRRFRLEPSGREPGGHELTAERLIALPELFGPSLGGVPLSAPGGFISVDRHCAVRGLERVWAAGDATDFPVKLGGIAAQQADTAAEAIAALAGAPVQPTPLRPRIDAVLLGGGPPLHLSAELVGGRPIRGEAGVESRFSGQRKIAARRLAPLLESLMPAPAPSSRL